MKTSLLSPPLASLLTLALCACGTSTSNSEAIPGYPRTVASFGGSELVMQRPPKRVIPANAAALELLIDLGLRDRIVSIPKPAFEYGNVALVKEDWEGRTFENYLVEPMLSAAPDLVLTNPWQNPETTSYLVANGVTVLSLPEPKSLDDLLEAIRVTASIFGETQRAEALCADLKRRHAALEAREHQSVRVMTYTTFGTGSWTAAKDTTADLLIQLAGMRNASSEHGLEGHAAVDIETLLSIDPDYILVSGSVQDERWSTTLEAMRSDPALESLRALREDHIRVMPLQLFTANSHYLLDGAEALAALIESP